MSIDFRALQSAPRILIEAHLQPVAGTRIQPTGFPDLGAAVYDAPDGTPMLLVESAQSMANRLEAVCWDEGGNRIAPALDGLPYVEVRLDGLGTSDDTTNSLLEFHRLNSPYIMTGRNAEGKLFSEVMSADLGLVFAEGKKEAKAAKKQAKEATELEEAEEADASDGDEKERKDIAGVVDLRKLARVCFRYDPNSLIHGLFLEKIAGRLRQPRALSAFIEATGVGRADSGGVKFDRVLPKPSIAGVDAKGGYGNVPFHRSEYTARSITAFFSLDLAQIRGYGLEEAPTQLLIALSLWKIRAFLDSTMRLRTACELELLPDGDAIVGKRPQGFVLPGLDDLGAQVCSLLDACGPHFAEPPVTTLTWSR